VTSRGFKQLPPEIAVDEVEAPAAQPGVR
jgi:hypothetical protein